MQLLVLRWRCCVWCGVAVASRWCCCVVWCDVVVYVMCSRGGSHPTPPPHRPPPAPSQRLTHWLRSSASTPNFLSR